GAVLFDYDSAVSPLDVAELAFARRINRHGKPFAKFEQRLHPLFAAVNHRLHRSVARGYCADPATETRITARRRRIINHKWAFTCAGIAIERSQITVVAAPRRRNLQ